jgi:predicted transglutaminase-like cysteine proteinase
MPEYVPDSGAMMVGNLTFASIGYLNFCRRQLEECCQSANTASRVKFTKNLCRQLNIVNLNVNIDIAPQTDVVLYQKPECWTYPRSSGDCEGYMLQKRKDLIAMSGLQTRCASPLR